MPVKAARGAAPHGSRRRHRHARHMHRPDDGLTQLTCTTAGPCTHSGWIRRPARRTATTSPTTSAAPRSPGTPSRPAEPWRSRAVGILRGLFRPRLLGRTRPRPPSGAGPRAAEAAGGGPGELTRKAKKTMTQACAIWRGDIGAYIVGALDAEASARVRRHLRACRACRDDFHDLVPVRDWLGWLVLVGSRVRATGPAGPRQSTSARCEGTSAGGCAGAGCPRPLPQRPPSAAPRSRSRRSRLIRPCQLSAPSIGPPACTGRPA